MGGTGRRHVGLIASERKQLWPSCFLHRFRIDETHRTSLCVTREVSSLSRYVPNLEFVTSPARFASTSHNTQPLWPQTTFLKSPRRPASIGAPLAPPNALVASGSTMCSSSPLQPSVSLHHPLNSVRRDPYVKRKLSTMAFQQALARPGRGSRCPATCHTSSFYPLQLVSPPSCAILNV